VSERWKVVLGSLFLAPFAAIWARGYWRDLSTELAHRPSDNRLLYWGRIGATGLWLTCSVCGFAAAIFWIVVAGIFGFTGN
jgi:hypothetical protein